MRIHLTNLKKTCPAPEVVEYVLVNRVYHNLQQTQAPQQIIINQINNNPHINNFIGDIELLQEFPMCQVYPDYKMKRTIPMVEFEGVDCSYNMRWPRFEAILEDRFDLDPDLAHSGCIQSQ